MRVARVLVIVVAAPFVTSACTAAGASHDHAVAASAPAVTTPATIAVPVVTEPAAPTVPAPVPVVTTPATIAVPAPVPVVTAPATIAVPAPVPVVTAPAAPTVPAPVSVVTAPAINAVVTTAPVVSTPAVKAAPAAVRPVRVAFVGDSNIVRSTGATLAILHGAVRAQSAGGGRYEPSFFAQAGMQLAPTFWKVKLANPNFRPDVVVLDIGINDTLSPAFYDDYGPKIDAFMSLIPRKVPVLWPGYPIEIERATRRAGALAVNHAWALAQARWPNLIIVPWGALADHHPEWIDRSDPNPDQWVHYTQAGYRALLTLELARLNHLS